jgi:Fic family protein
MSTENNRLSPEALLQAMANLAANGHPAATSAELAKAVGTSLPTAKRMLAKLVEQSKVEVVGKARATRYRIQTAAPSQAASGETPGHSVWSTASLELRRRLSLPLAARQPVTYRREFVEAYRPNETSLLPHALAEELAALGRLPGQQPAGTYVRKVLEQLLIDLSWSSSHLEGNRYSLLDTEELFKSGKAATDSDAVMLLNHKTAIEFMVDAVPAYGLDGGLVRNLHAILMQDLLADVETLGTIRNKVVNISGTTYVPVQTPSVLQEMFEQIIAKAQFIKNPVESAFFLWVNLAYLQPFEDGNKRVSRLAANIPLMLYNQAPLSFLDVARDDYALAMMGVYEFRDVAMAVDLFAWTYRRSHAKYQVVVESMGLPDPFRVQYREALNEAIGAIVRDRIPMATTLANLALPSVDTTKFVNLLEQELNALAIFNCARYRLGLRQTQSWIDEGRPR